MTRRPELPEVTLLEGARLFVAAFPLRDLQSAELRRFTFYSLMWLSGGAATFVCDTERFDVAADSLLCTAPGQVHWWEQAAAGAQLTLLGFVPEIFTGGVLDVRLITDLPLFEPGGTTLLPTAGTAGAALADLFALVWQRYTQLAEADPARTWRVLPRQREGVLLAYLHAILAEAATLDLAEAPPPTQRAEVRLARLFRLHAVMGALQRQPVSHYAELLHVTPDHLTRVVRRVTGKAPSAWLHERLLLEAKRRLTFTSQPVELSAHALLFPTATQFSKWVRTHTGQTPREIRQGLRSDIEHS